MCVIDYKNMEDFCSGCGVCAAVCPRENIRMNTSAMGDLRAYKGNNCKEGCSLCKTVCPSMDSSALDPIAKERFMELNYDAAAGFYSSCHVGHVNNTQERLQSASGGLATWVLKRLLEEQMVDRVIAVRPAFENDQDLFKFDIFDNASDVGKASGSAYYPVEISEVLRRIIKEEDASYAIIGLPCVVLGIRKAQEVNVILRKRIKFVFSLTCGQMMNRFYPEFIGAKGGLHPLNVKSIRFRKKNPEGMAHDYEQVAVDRDGKPGKPQKNRNTYHNWKYNFFTHKSCLACDDLFGELADATFMDAWLPDYARDGMGNSIVLSRNAEIDQVLTKGVECKELSAELIGIDLVLLSQLNKVKDRKNLIKGRLCYLEKKGIRLSRRLEPDQTVYRQNKRYINLCFQACDLSKVIWSEARLQAHGIEYMMRKSRILNLQIKFYEKKKMIINIIKRKVLRKSGV